MTKETTFNLTDSDKKEEPEKEASSVKFDGGHFWFDSTNWWPYPYEDSYGCFALQEEETKEQELNAVEEQTEPVSGMLKKLSKDDRATLREKVAKRMSEEYDRIRAVPDSGAADFVGPRSFAPQVKLEE